MTPVSDFPTPTSLLLMAASTVVFVCAFLILVSLFSRKDGDK